MDNYSSQDEAELEKKQKAKNRMKKVKIVAGVLVVYAALAVIHFTFFDDRFVALEEFVGDTAIAFVPPVDVYTKNGEDLPPEPPNGETDGNLPTEPPDGETDEDTPLESSSDENGEDSPPEPPPDENGEGSDDEPPEFIHTAFSMRFDRVIMTFDEEDIHQADFQPFALLFEIEEAVNQLATTLVLIYAAERNDITLTTLQERIVRREIVQYREWFESIDAEWQISDERAMQILGARRFVNPLMDIYVTDSAAEGMTPEQRLSYFFDEVVNGWRLDTEIIVYMHGIQHFLEIPHQH